MRGRLCDKRFGEDLHVIEAEIRITVLDGLITGITAAMPAVPLEECREALSAVEGLRGETIKPGFSERVKDVVGSGRGCTHLASLIMNMGNVSVQGRAAFVRKNFTEAQASQRLAENAEQLGLLDSCVCWREDGPVVRRWREQQEALLAEADREQDRE